MASASAAPGRLATRAPRRRRDALPVPDTRAAAHAPSRGAAAVEVPATADRQHRRADLGSPRCPSRHLRQDLGDLGHGVQEGRQPHRASSEGAEVDGTDGRRCRLTPALRYSDSRPGATGRFSSEICCTARCRFSIPAATATPAWTRNKRWPAAAGFSGGRPMNGNCSSPRTSVVRVPWKSDGTGLNSSSAHGPQPARRGVRPPLSEPGPHPRSPPARESISSAGRRPRRRPPCRPRSRTTSRRRPTRTESYRSRARAPRHRQSQFPL